MTCVQRKTIQTLLNICHDRGISGTRVEDKDGVFTLFRDGETVVSGSYDKVVWFLKGLAEKLGIVQEKLGKAKGKAMSEKLKKKYPEKK